MELVREPDFELASGQDDGSMVDANEVVIDHHHPHNQLHQQIKQPSSPLAKPPTFTITPSQSVSATTVDSTYISLPPVPTHDPNMSQRSRRSLDLSMIPSAISTRTSNRSSSSPRGTHTLNSNIAFKPRHHSVSSGSIHTANSSSLRDAEKEEEEHCEKSEEEEELEELEDTDDEVEEMAEEHDLIRESEEMITLDRMETKQLVELTRNFCLSFVQSLLNTMANNTTYTRLIGGNTRMEKLSKAADEACTSLVNSASYSNQEGNQAQQSIERLAVLVVNAADEIEGSSTSVSANGGSNTAMEDIKLIRALSTLLASLDPDKLQGTLSQASSPSSSSHIYPTTSIPSEFWQKNSSHRNSISGSSSGDLRSPTSATHWPATSANGINTSANPSTPSPASSREELRNPFTDEELRVPQNCGSSSNLAHSINPTNGFDERWRDRPFHLGGGSNTTTNGEVQRLIRLFDEIERRCHDSTIYGKSPDYQDPRPQTSEAASLQAQIGAGRSLLVTRKGELLNINASRQRSISPSSPSPTFGPSRRNSRASSPAFNSGPPLEHTAGDPTGEATVAGMMAGGIGTSNRHGSSRNASNRNSIGFMPRPPQLPRRNSTKSEKSLGLHSPPPRYSEDSTRHWASVAFPALTGQEAGVGNLSHHAVSNTQMEPLQRRRSHSSDLLPGFRSGPPAYATDFSVTAHGQEKEGSHSSSLAASETTLAGAMTKGIPKVYQNEKEEFNTPDEAIPARKSSRIDHTASTTVASRSMHPAHELKMLQSGIDRLMDNAPQMIDQRVGPPDPQRRAHQKEAELNNMVERMSKAGRLDDQRAAPPMQALGSTTRNLLNDRMPKESVSGLASSSMAGIGFSPATSTVQSMVHTAGSEHHSGTYYDKSQKPRRFPSVGSINLGSLAIRRASHLLDNGLRSNRGRERGEQAISNLSSPTSERRGLDDLTDFEQVSSRLASASMRGLNDQRSAPPRKLSASQRSHVKLQSHDASVTSPISAVTALENQRDSIDSDVDLFPPPRRGKSKLAAMGMEPSAMDDEDDDLFDMISSSTRRMANQDVIAGKSTVQTPGSLRTSHSNLLKNVRSPGSDRLDPTSDQTSPKSDNRSPIASESFFAKQNGLASSNPSSDHSGELKSLFLPKNDVLNPPLHSSGKRVSQNVVEKEDNEQTKIAVRVKGERRASIRCIAETQDRLGRLLVYIWLERTDLQSRIENIKYDIQDTEGHRSKLSMSVSLGENGISTVSTLDFELPCRIREGPDLQGEKVKQDNSWLFHFAIEENANQKHHEDSNVLFSAKQLTFIGATQWQCAICSNDLMDFSSTDRFIPLPSQHWEELVDAWMCHTDQQLNDTLLKAQKNIEHHTGLKEGQVHVADSQLILSSTSLISGKIGEENVSIACTESNKKWIDLKAVIRAKEILVRDSSVLRWSLIVLNLQDHE